MEKIPSKNSNNSWKPENLFDILITGKDPRKILEFFGGDTLAELFFQPSELFVTKQIPDRVFWHGDRLIVVELKITVNSETCAQLELQRAVTIAYYIKQLPFPKNYHSKYQASLEKVINVCFSVQHPKNHFEKLLSQRGIRCVSLEQGIESKIPLNYKLDPLPLILADFRAKINTAFQAPEKFEKLTKKLEELLERAFTREERLFLERYPKLLVFPQIPLEWSMHIKNLQEMIQLTESDLKQILLENLYLLSPEERLMGLKPEEEKKLLELLKKKLEESQ